MRTMESEDVFEISDFTVATEWEKFIARLDSIITEWGLANSDRKPYTPLNSEKLQAISWQCRAATVNYGDQRFNITYYRAVMPGPTMDVQPVSIPDYLPHFSKDLMSPDTDWLPLPPPQREDQPGNDTCGVPLSLVRWSGLQEFILLTPFCASDSIFSEDRRNMVLSAFAVAMGNCVCDLPMFVQVHKDWRLLYFGIGLSTSVRTYFDMVHLKRAPSRLTHLAGLLEAFKAKLNSPVFPLPPVKVSVCLCFQLADDLDASWTQVPPDMDELFGAVGPPRKTSTSSTVGLSQLGSLPFGACQDPIHAIQLLASWSCVHEDMIVENDIYSDLNPMAASKWELKIEFTKHVKCLLGDLLDDFLKLFDNNTAVSQVLGIMERDFGELQASMALARLTESSVPELSSLGSFVRSKVSGHMHGATSSPQFDTHDHHTKSGPASPGEQMPIGPADLHQILVFLFPDAVDPPKQITSRSSSPLPTQGGFPGKAVSLQTPTRETAPSELSSTTTSQYDLNFTDTESLDISAFKAAPLVSLSSRICLALFHTLNSVQGVKAFCQLWHEIVLELRYRWERGIPLPLLEPGQPDLSSCILHQDLQMLNCCIRHKISRGNAQETQPCDGEDSDRISVNFTTDNDEFFDCAEERAELLSLTKASGRLKQHDNLNLLSQQDGNVDEDGLVPLYVPVTQDPSPVTESMLSEQAAILTQLGTTKDASQLRAKMQSASLVSDMQAFKAANPGCCMEDFVRWFSPRDYIVDQETSEGRLSERMSVPGNMWHDAWEAARPAPAAKQKPLFDDTKEAEKILHRLSSLNVSDVAQLICPVLFVQAYKTVIDESSCLSEFLNDTLSSLSNRLSQTTCLLPTQYSYAECAGSLRQVETLISQQRALKTKFHELLFHLGLTGATKQDGVAIEKDCRQNFDAFIHQLMGGNVVCVPGGPSGPYGTMLKKMFQKKRNSSSRPFSPNTDQQQVEQPRFTAPCAKEYILRSSVPRPQAYSRVTAQRLYANVSEKEFRLFITTSEDSTFF